MQNANNQYTQQVISVPVTEEEGIAIREKICWVTDIYHICRSPLPTSSLSISNLQA